MKKNPQKRDFRRVRSAGTAGRLESRPNQAEQGNVCLHGMGDGNRPPHLGGYVEAEGSRRSEDE